MWYASTHVAEKHQLKEKKATCLPAEVLQRYIVVLTSYPAQSCLRYCGTWWCVSAWMESPGVSRWLPSSSSSLSGQVSERQSTELSDVRLSIYVEWAFEKEPFISDFLLKINLSILTWIAHVIVKKKMERKGEMIRDQRLQKERMRLMVSNWTCTRCYSIPVQCAEVNLFPAKQKTTWLSSLKLCEKNNTENEKLKVFLQQMDIWEYFFNHKIRKITSFSTWKREEMRKKSCSRVETLAAKRLRQDPPCFEFWSFLTFLHHGIEEVERHLLWKFYKKIRRKSWSNVPPKLLACIGFLYKVVHKIGRLRKFNRSREIEFNFLTARTISMNLAHLFSIPLATKCCLRFFNFCLGT